LASVSTLSQSMSIRSADFSGLCRGTSRRVTRAMALEEDRDPCTIPATTDRCGPVLIFKK
jgi:hypothetical protein